MQFAWAAGPGEESTQGRAPRASIEPLTTPRAVLRASSLAAAEFLEGAPWRAYGRDRRTGLDQLGFIGEVYHGATGRIRDFGRDYPAPDKAAIATHAGAILDALDAWRGLSRIRVEAAQSGDVIAFASPSISPALALGVVVSPAREGPGSLLMVAPGPGVHRARYGGDIASGLRANTCVGALTWRGAP